MSNGRCRCTWKEHGIKKRGGRERYRLARWNTVFYVKAAVAERNARGPYRAQGKLNQGEVLALLRSAPYPVIFGEAELANERSQFPETTLVISHVRPALRDHRTEEKLNPDEIPALRSSSPYPVILVRPSQRMRRSLFPETTLADLSGSPLPSRSRRFLGPQTDFRRRPRDGRSAQNVSRGPTLQAHAVPTLWGSLR
jgi:hypothetical protein